MIHLWLLVPDTNAFQLVGLSLMTKVATLDLQHTVVMKCRRRRRCLKN